MWRVDFHIHTFASPDSLTPVQAVLASARRRGLDMVAITDHNTIQGALEAWALAPEQVIVGEEIMTTQGELLAYFLEETVPPGLSPEETIARVRAQGGVVAVAHPFDARRKGHWQMEDLQRIAPLVDAIEGLNARCFSRQANLEAQKFAQAWGLPVLAGSDAHTAREVGQVVTVLPRFASAVELKEALTASRLEGRISWPTVTLASRYAKLRKRWRPAERA
ncbi:MAG: PHP domain-containing protein [Chloroflexi bacterium]|nr:PHP domain-containing protein [Chloroflexota bacterium]